MKPEIGKISHEILSKIVTCVREKTKFNHWKNVYSCLEWFKKIERKRNKSFIIFDIVSFYPSISRELLIKALEWANEYIVITIGPSIVIFL